MSTQNTPLRWKTCPACTRRFRDGWGNDDNLCADCHNATVDARRDRVPSPPPPVARHATWCGRCDRESRTRQAEVSIGSWRPEGATVRTITVPCERCHRSNAYRGDLRLGAWLPGRPRLDMPSPGNRTYSNPDSVVR